MCSAIHVRNWDSIDVDGNNNYDDEDDDDWRHERTPDLCYLSPLGSGQCTNSLPIYVHYHKPVK